MTPQQTKLLHRALDTMGAGSGPTLYGPDGQPMATYTYRRAAAKRSGSLKNWIPQRLANRQTEATEREKIVERSIDLVNNDPHAAGIAEGISSVVVGSGLVPHPQLDPDIFPDMDKDAIRRVQAQQRAVYQTWAPFADAGERMHFGSIQFLAKRNMLQFGEYFVLLPMLKKTDRPYSLACQVIHPLRVKTPSDKVMDGRIRDGVELGSRGEAKAYWIKKEPANIFYNHELPDTSDNFSRIPVKRGHRWNILHGFIVQEPDQIRGMPFFAPAMKYFRDFNDLLDAELVSSIVTAAFSLFIETGAGIDPIFPANQMAGIGEDQEEEERYQELTPGSIMYGSIGEKPYPIAANRPGTTFEPFSKLIKKSMAMALNIPYPVLFKDVEGVNFAGFRSAMMDAWRVFTMYRVWLGQNFCQKVFSMLQEEAYLKGEIKVEDFYKRRHQLTRAEWRGSPKGDIEPVKAIQADILAVKNNLKTRAEAIAERGGDIRTTFDQLEEERDLLLEKGLTDGTD